MSTALTLYYATAASSVLSTANQLYHAGTATASGLAYTQLGTATGYGEVYAQGNTNAWAGAGSLLSADGHGFFLDDTTLDGQTIAAGNWSAVVRLVAALGTGGTLGGTINADIYARVFRYRSGTYTQIVSMSLTGQTLNNTITNYSLPSTAGSSMDFLASDKLYYQIDLNIISSTGGVTQTVRLNRLSTDTATFAGDPFAVINTPGFDPTAPPSNTVYLLSQHAAIGRIQ